MTVREIIDLMESYPGDMRLVVSAYEEGYDDLSPRTNLCRPVCTEHVRARLGGSSRANREILVQTPGSLRLSKMPSCSAASPTDSASVITRSTE